MKMIRRRLSELEKTRPRKTGPDIRGMVRALSVDDARYCLWVMKWANHGEIYEHYPAPDNATPSTEDIARVNELLPDLHLIGCK